MVDYGYFNGTFDDDEFDGNIDENIDQDDTAEINLDDEDTTVGDENNDFNEEPDDLDEESNDFDGESDDEELEEPDQTFDNPLYQMGFSENGGWHYEDDYTRRKERELIERQIKSNEKDSIRQRGNDDGRSLAHWDYASVEQRRTMTKTERNERHEVSRARRIEGDTNYAHERGTGNPAKMR